MYDARMGKSELELGESFKLDIDVDVENREPDLVHERDPNVRRTWNTEFEIGGFKGEIGWNEVNPNLLDKLESVVLPCGDIYIGNITENKVNISYPVMFSASIYSLGPDNLVDASLTISTGNDKTIDYKGEILQDEDGVEAYFPMINYDQEMEDGKSGKELLLFPRNNKILNNLSYRIDINRGE